MKASVKPTEGKERLKDAPPKQEVEEGQTTEGRKAVP
jgi:hypothetical protein